MLICVSSKKMVLGDMKWEVEENQSFVVSYLYIINTIIAADVLAIPWAYQEAGWAAGLLSQALASVFAIIIAFLLVQSLSRMEVLAELSEKGYTIKPLSFKDFFKKTDPEQFVQPPTESDSEDEHLSMIMEYSAATPKITHRRFDFTEMANVLLGKKGGLCFIVIIAIVQYSTLAGFASIISTSLTSLVPLGPMEACNIYDEPDFFGSCRINYWTYLLIFAGLAVFLVMLGLHNQVLWQTSASVLRFLTILVMIATCSAALGTNSNLEDSGSNEGGDVDTFNILGFASAFPMITLVMYFHNTIPNTTQFLHNKGQNLMPAIIGSIITVSVLLSAIGIVLTASVSNVETLATLNWNEYSAGENPSDRAWWAYLVAFFIGLYPAVDVLSAYPLDAINLSDNLISWKYGHISGEDLSKKTYFFFRLLVGIPPLVAAFFVYDISDYLEVAGTFSVIMIGVFIPLFDLATRKMLPMTSQYDLLSYPDKWAWAIIIISLIQFPFFVTCQIIVWIGFY